ncbi:dihydrolipoyl dehydrogenase [Chitinispirillales bacterium ANBcel5]|uniref:dihydrolipoyl dehydrogenase n=1 Tax=Cellulosispirillum alkaliphilum TaxID=3039283 RepID=UPI002A54BCF6|nr:dihydrolipoyl dehydrogenase [Chitinispirillales bacterium ANBcel5]
MSQFDYDVVIIGSGPGGYVAAIRASQLKLKTAIVEQGKLGGVCLNIGCIPSKALIHQAEIFRSRLKLKTMGITIDESGFDYESVYKASRKAADSLSRGVAFLLKKNGVEVISGKATLSGEQEITVNGDRKVSAKSIILATGSSPKQIKGFEIDKETIISSDEALMLKKVPESVLILGGGAIGCEFAHILNAFGSKVQMVEVMENILPYEDSEVTNVLKRSFKKRGIEIATSTKAVSMEKNENGATVILEDSSARQSSITVEKVLVVTGRAPNTAGLGIEQLGISTTRGFIEVGDYGQTNVKSIYAIGDIVSTPLLAHVASKEGEIAVEHIAGRSPQAKIDTAAVPGAVYCEPQIASFGLTEEKAKAAAIDYRKATFPYRGSGKAVAIEDADGLVKILYKPETKEIIGAHIGGAQATELIHELLLARHSELLPQDIADMVHAHPTLSETVMEAARAVEGWAIHI